MFSGFCVDRVVLCGALALALAGTQDVPTTRQIDLTLTEGTSGKDLRYSPYIASMRASFLASVMSPSLLAQPSGGPRRTSSSGSGRRERDQSRCEAKVGAKVVEPPSRPGSEFAIGYRV